MRLEDEIKAKHFDSEVVKAQINILFTAGWLYNIVSARLRKYGLSHEQFNVLRILRGQHPRAIPQKDVLARMINRNSNLTKILRKLKEKDLVQVEKSTADRREYDIVISEPGLDLLKVIDREFVPESLPIQSLSVSEAFHLNFLLDKARESPE